MEKEQLVSMVTAVQEGQADAAGALYDAFQSDIYYHIFKTVNDPELAADLTQDTFMEILQTIDKLQEPAAFVTWAKQIAYHRCTAYFRKRHEILADENEDGYSVFDTIEEDREEFIPGEALEKEELKKAIHDIILSLPEEQRSAILLRYFDEISVKEIASIQGVTEGTVKSRLNYGRKAIKEAVERYEKKNGIKLHCAGVIPLLLWLAREYAVAKGISLTAGGASAAFTAASATAATASTTAAAGTAAAGTAKAVGGIAAKKLVVGITAAAVLTGGAAAAVILSDEEPERDRKPSVSQTEPAKIWIGYGEAGLGGSDGTRYELIVDKMNKKVIEGRLTLTYQGNPKHDTTFTGEAMETDEDGRITYQITLDTPHDLGVIPETILSETPLIYDPAADTFAFKYLYHAHLVRAAVLEESARTFKKGTYSGIGRDGAYNFNDDGHLFRIEIYEASDLHVRGKITISYQGKVDYEAEFEGDGYVMADQVRYGIVYSPRRTVWKEMSIYIESSWLYYNVEADTYQFSGSWYSVVMEK